MAYGRATSRKSGIAHAVVLALALNLSLAPAAFAQSRYRVVHGWPVLPDNLILDEVSAVAVDLHDDVFVLTRAGRKWPDSGELDQTPIPVATVLVFDGRSGRFLTKWGENIFALPHSITVDNADNIWVTDVALHQVFKLSHEGKLLLTLGERGKPGDDTSNFNRPSDVAVATDGSFSVSDDSPSIPAIPGCIAGNECDASRRPGLPAFSPSGSHLRSNRRYCS